MDFYTDIVADYASVPVTLSTTTAPKCPIYTTNTKTVSGKNLILAQFETTNNLPYTVGVGRYIKRNDGAIIGSATMANVTPAMHHMVVNIGVWDPQPIMDATYSLVVYAVSNSAKVGNAIKIEQGYGYLQIMNF